MLPSLGLTSMAIIATYLAGKIPVMINWTLPKESLDHTIRFSGTEIILTSSNFYAKVKNDQLASHEGKMVFLEDRLKTLSFSDKVLGALASRLRIRKKNRSDIAVVLFTS